MLVDFILTMSSQMYLPQEILTQIASLLSVRDLAAFRLASHRYYDARTLVLARNSISVLNIVSDISELKSLL